MSSRPGDARSVTDQREISHLPRTGASARVHDTSELRGAAKAVYYHPECSEDVSSFARNMRDLRNSQM